MRREHVRPIASVLVGIAALTLISPTMLSSSFARTAADADAPDKTRAKTRRSDDVARHGNSGIKELIIVDQLRDRNANEEALRWQPQIGTRISAPIQDVTSIRQIIADTQAEKEAEPDYKSLGKVRPSAASEPSPFRHICDAAREARARQSPAAPGLEAQCRTIGEPQKVSAEALQDLAARGEGVAGANPWAAALRGSQPDGPDRRGFDIGLAAAEGQTGWGPGKQAIRYSLAPAEQAGFDAAVSFSLDRNRNPELAAAGMAIAGADPRVAAAGHGETDPLYRLGFDIGTGLFGDPALGARGNTATGPGSLGIRNALSLPGQRGFDAAMRYHFGRKY